HQWLIQRGCHFLQVTELLYRIAEQANGKRTLEEIAQKFTDSTDWLVSADNVRQLIQTRLMPLGLVAGADGPVPPPSVTAGKVRGMGAGLYLIYPALYTDVTDSYRLGRCTRVRTDLGGVYFHLIFSLGLVALSLLTGKELLLFAVVMIDLQIIGQFIPFVRFD